MILGIHVYSEKEGYCIEIDKRKKAREENEKYNKDLLYIFGFFENFLRPLDD